MTSLTKLMGATVPSMSNTTAVGSDLLGAAERRGRLAAGSSDAAWCPLDPPFCERGARATA